MTNKEAIEELKPLTEYSISENGYGSFPIVSTLLQVEAIKLAIKALKLADCPQLQAECKACGGAFCDGEEETT